MGNYYILYYTAGFDGFFIMPFQELLEGTSYSVILSFRHDVVIQSVSNIDTGENCTARPINSKTVNISCFDLLYGASYSPSVEGMASLDNGGHLEFTTHFDFATEELPIISGTG